MSGNFWLDWATQAISFFNGSLMLWLGLTIALNAERSPRGRVDLSAGGPRQGWGSTLMAASLLVGALFFVSHSTLLSYDLNTVSQGLNFWWHLGWWPVIALPLAWYVLVLWYSGYWDEPDTALHRRHRPALALAGIGAALMVGLALFANPLPALGATREATPAIPWTIGGLPVLVLAYPIYIVLCVGLALDALVRPGPTRRMLGDQARQRAQPWLTTASGVLLVVCLLVSGTMVWVVRQLGGAGQTLVVSAGVATTIAWADLAIDGLIAAAVVMLGQALAAYEVFTGKTLPRRGLLRFWRNALMLSGGFSVLAALSLAADLRPVFIGLLSTALLSGFYALFAAQSYAERERYMNQLRPFVAGQGLQGQLLEQMRGRGVLRDVNRADQVGVAIGVGTNPTTYSGVEAAAAEETFRALCRDVLDARMAILASAGPAAALAGAPLVYSASGQPPDGIAGLAMGEIVATLRDSGAAVMPLEPAQSYGTQWAVPLRSERPSPSRPAGLIGVLLLGEKTGGGLYTQEEIDIARAGGERLIDTLTSAELARRLVALQRHRLAESQVLDQRTRRVLHDDVLPQLHAALLHLHGLAESNGAAEQAGQLLADAHRQLSALLRELPDGQEPEVGRLGLFAALHRLASGEFARAFDAVEWAVDAGTEERARALPALAAEVLFYAAREAMRNASRHAAGHGQNGGSRSPLKLRISAEWLEAGLRLAVEDNGVGLDGSEKALAGDETTGHGLALHSTLLAVVGGRLTRESEAGKGTRIVLELPAEAMKWS